MRFKGVFRMKAGLAAAVIASAVTFMSASGARSEAVAVSKLRMVEESRPVAALDRDDNRSGRHHGGFHGGFHGGHHGGFHGGHHGGFHGGHHGGHHR